MIVSSKIQYPFNKAIELGHSVDYKCPKGADHSYVKYLGYTIEGHSDCSYSCKELPGLSLTSYGDWGTLYDWATEATMQVFNYLVESGDIQLWRITAYITRNGDVVSYSYEEGRGWKRCVHKVWEQCEAPF